ncbi:FAD-dependent oxidoreductase [Nocardia inohanensis]|uniref:FAD-dependent oxidoreductase n=1 Tax=Nocardia inohanensis TaxID=209246 RepID=UPI0008305675|nr:NAD(P)/FAD-dependent oxidoreductase [Nocardia inohanensis]
MVVIIGGGIAGSALAGGLARQDIPVTLYEQQPNGPGGGAFLFIDDRGHRALTELGVAQEAIEAASYPVTGGLSYANGLGRRGTTTGRGHRFWMRRELIDMLGAFVADSGVKTEYGTVVSDLARFEGETVIGADGIDSTVRAVIEPGRVPEYAGDVVLYGMTSTPVELPTAPATLHFFAEMPTPGPPSSTLGHIWRPGDPAALWFVRLPRPALSGGDDLGLRPISEWAEAILAATPTNRALLETFLGATEVVHVSNARNVPLETAAAPQDSILLIGDADHAITPAAGVGARDALEDAYAVHRALTAGSSPAVAMTERRQRIREDRAQAQAAMRRSAG